MEEEKDELEEEEDVEEERRTKIGPRSKKSKDLRKMISSHDNISDRNEARRKDEEERTVKKKRRKTDVQFNDGVAGATKRRDSVGDVVLLSLLSHLGHDRLGDSGCHVDKPGSKRSVRLLLGVHLYSTSRCTSVQLVRVLLGVHLYSTSRCTSVQLVHVLLGVHLVQLLFRFVAGY